MRIHACCLWLLLTVNVPSLRAQQPPSDPLGENLFPPELVMQFQSELGLTDGQRETIEGDLQKAGPRFEQMHGDLQQAVEKLAGALKKERIDEKEALAHFDKVQNLERDIKRLHLSLVIGLKNKLTPEQQARLKEIKSKLASGQLRPPAEVQRAFEEKLKKVQAGVQRWQDEARDPSPVAEIMQQFEPLMKSGKHKEAEAVLDGALKLLGESEKDKAEKPEKKKSALPAVKSNESARSNRTPEALEVEIQSLEADWALMFDDDQSVLAFFDHALKRFGKPRSEADLARIDRDASESHHAFAAPVSRGSEKLKWRIALANSFTFSRFPPLSIGLSCGHDVGGTND